MPPQDNPTPAPTPSFNMDSFSKNPKFMTTITTFAIYVPILMVADFIVSIVASGFRYGSYVEFFTVSALIMTIISGVVGGVVGGGIFYFLYDPVHNWIKGVSVLTKYIYNMFTLFWVPSLICSLVVAVMGLLGLSAVGSIAGAYGVGSVGGAFAGVVVSLVVNLAIYYYYAKAISAKLEPLYPW